MICKECHAFNPSGTVRCSHCTAPLADSDVTVTLPARGEVPVSPDASEQEGPDRPMGGGILEPGRVLGNRYEILTLLGEGGMGAVYKAKDLELERIVALKIIRPELARSPEIQRRFKQELVLARQITQHNVIRIYDLGVADGMRFISMEYIEGEDLATLLEQRGKYDPDEAARIVGQVCEGLSEAHGQGVIHRDLKPQNLMIDAEGKVYIMDFGIAGTTLGSLAAHHDVDARSNAATPMSPGLTQDGTLLGTPHYMSPEQAKGEKVDARSDLFTLGIILYELVTGKLPYAADDPRAALFLRIEEKPVAPAEVEPAVPNQLNTIILKCLAANLDERYQTAEDLLADLNSYLGIGKDWLSRRKIAAGVAAVVALSTGMTYWLATRPPEAPPDPVTVLVADIENTTAETLFDGTLEPMFNVALEGASFITTYSRAQAQELATELTPDAAGLDEETARLVALRQGISVVVAGAIHNYRDQLSISVRAVDAVTGDLLVTREANNLSRTSVLSAVAGLAAAIRRALGDETPESAQLTAAETFTASSVEAAHAYAEGQSLLDQGKMTEAIGYYQDAVKLDPELGRAYAGLAVASINLNRRDEAKKHYERALDLLDRMSERERYRTLGTYYGAFLGNLPQAIDVYETLVAAYPADAAGWTNLGIACLLSLNVPEAVEAARRALELEPWSAQTRLNYSEALMFAADFENAITEAQRVLEKSSSFELAYLRLAISTLALDDVERSREVYASLSEVSQDGYSMAMMGEADLEMYLGRLPRAIAVLENGAEVDAARAATPEQALKYVAMAEAYLGMNDRAHAILFAEQAAELAKVESVLLPTARVLLQADRPARALEIANKFENMLQLQTSSYARLIEGEIALEDRRFADAVRALQEAQKLHDCWLSHFLLGRAYIEAGRFAEALGQFDTCLSRRGETGDLMLANTSTLRYLPPLYYWLARAQESMGMGSAAAENYQRYLMLRKEADPPDPRAREVEERLAAGRLPAGV